MKVRCTAFYGYVSVQISVTHQIVRLNVLNNFCVGRVSVKSLPGRLERVLCAADARSRVRTQSGKRVGGVLERRGAESVHCGARVRSAQNALYAARE